MTKKTLRISGALSLPTEFATKSIAILAQRRKGKTYTASVLAEECVAAEIPFVALDPTGAWWGLRASADGKKEGLPVYVFGGEHPSDPELELLRSAGKEVADFVVLLLSFSNLTLAIAFLLHLWAHRLADKMDTTS